MSSTPRVRWKSQQIHHVSRIQRDWLFLTGANLAYKLYQFLSGSSKEYEKVINELFCRAQGTFTCWAAPRRLPARRVDILTNGMNEAMESFMGSLSRYTESLQEGGGSLNIVRSAF